MNDLGCGSPSRLAWKRVRVTSTAWNAFRLRCLPVGQSALEGPVPYTHKTVANTTATGTPNANRAATNFRFRKAPTVWRRIRRTKLHIKQQFAISLYIVVVGYNRHVLVTERARRWGIWTHSMVVFFQGRLPQLKNSGTHNQN